MEIGLLCPNILELLLYARQLIIPAILYIHSDGAAYLRIWGQAEYLFSGQFKELLGLELSSVFCKLSNVACELTLLAHGLYLDHN